MKIFSSHTSCTLRARATLSAEPFGLEPLGLELGAERLMAERLVEGSKGSPAQCGTGTRENVNTILSKG